MNLRLLKIILFETVIEEIDIFADLIFQNGIEFIFNELIELIGETGFILL